MPPGLSSGCRWRASTRHLSRSRPIDSISGSAFSIALTAPPARQCGCGSSACPARPLTRRTPVVAPRQAAQASKPVGSAADAGVGGDAVHDRRPAARAKRFFVGVAAEDDVAAQRHACPVQALEGEDQRGQPALHVVGAATVEPAIAKLRREWVAGPAVRRRCRDCVDVAVEEQGATPSRPGHAGGQLRATAKSRPAGILNGWSGPMGSGSQRSAIAPRPCRRRSGCAASVPRHGVDRRPLVPLCRRRSARR